MDGHERRGAGGVDREARAREVEEVRDARGEDGFGVALEERRPALRRGVGAELEVVARLHPGKDAALPRQAHRGTRVTGVLERVVTGLEEHALLGIEDFGLGRWHIEQRRIEDLELIALSLDEMQQINDTRFVETQYMLSQLVNQMNQELLTVNRR